jgi:hypothetical protein
MKKNKLPLCGKKSLTRMPQRVIFCMPGMPQSGNLDS